MRIQLKTDGGVAYFPALAAPRTLDDSDLDEADRATLAALTDAADFFNLPPDLSGAKPGAADYHSYTLTIEQAEQEHTVRFDDLTDDQRLMDLLAFIQAKLKK